MKTYKKPFQIRLPATKDSAPIPGPTIYIDCYSNFGEDFLTVKAHKQIDRARNKFARNLKTLPPEIKIKYSRRYQFLINLMYWMRSRSYRIEYFLKDWVDKVEKKG